MSTFRYFFVCVYACFFCESTVAQISDSSLRGLKLVKTIVLFRHGMRAPLHSYDFDPYAKSDHNRWPEGLGVLVNEGKNQMYQLGKRLRERYENLLIPYSNSVAEDVQMVTTAVDRCYQSGALVLAGFYPPDQEQIWNEDLLWQPVPIRSPSPDKVHIIGNKKKCPGYDEELSKVYKIKKNDTSINYLINFLSNFTSVKGALDVFHVGDYVRTKKSMNLTLPEKFNEDFLNRLNEFYVGSFSYLSYSSKMRQLLAGPLIKDIIDRIRDVIYNGSSNSKFYFYSGHDSSLTSLFDGLNLKRDFVPLYGASFIFEVYRSSSNDYLIKMLFSEDYTLNRINLQVLPNCEEYCPMGKLVQLFEKYITQDWEKECNL